jgi:signal peptidase I
VVPGGLSSTPGELPGPGAPGGKKKPGERNGFLEALILVLIALVLALSLKTYVAEAYEIKGRSMQPNFQNGQRVVVLKAFYGIHRGDIIVFSSPEDPTKDLIKRVIGLPGERIRISAGKVYIDGKKLPESYGPQHDARELGETIREEKIPPDHYYVLGDNRPDSHDSRYFDAVPASSLKGRVVVRWWPFSEFRSF